MSFVGGSYSMGVGLFTGRVGELSWSIRGGTRVSSISVGLGLGVGLSCHGA